MGRALQLPVSFTNNERIQPRPAVTTVFYSQVSDSCADCARWDASSVYTLVNSVPYLRQSLRGNFMDRLGPHSY